MAAWVVARAEASMRAEVISHNTGAATSGLAGGLKQYGFEMYIAKNDHAGSRHF
jgi:hypothetical protein